MAEFPSKVSTRTSSPAQGAGTSASALRPDLGFVRSILGTLMLLQLVSARGAPGNRGLQGGPPQHPIHSQPRLTRAPTCRAFPGGTLRTNAPEITLEAPHLESPGCRPCQHTHCAPMFRVPTPTPIIPPGGHQRPSTETLT